MSTITTSETPEARELSLVGKVELRIALAESDAKLQSTLNTYLPPLLLKLASDFVSVRNKVGCSTSSNDVLLCIQFLRWMYHLISLQVYVEIKGWANQHQMLGCFCLSAHQYKSQATVCLFSYITHGFTCHAL